MTARLFRQIDTVIAGNVIWTYDRRTDKVTRVEAAPAASPDLSDILKTFGARPITD